MIHRRPPRNKSEFKPCLGSKITKAIRDLARSHDSYMVFNGAIVSIADHESVDDVVTQFEIYQMAYEKGVREK